MYEAREIVQSSMLGEDVRNGIVQLITDMITDITNVDNKANNVKSIIYGYETELEGYCDILRGKKENISSERTEMNHIIQSIEELYDIS